MLLVYPPKKAGNFGQHNLGNGSSHAQTEARYPITTPHQRAPVRSNFRKKVAFREIACLPVGNAFFFSKETPGRPSLLGAPQAAKIFRRVRFYLKIADFKPAAPAAGARHESACRNRFCMLHSSFLPWLPAAAAAASPAAAARERVAQHRNDPQARRA